MIDIKGHKNAKEHVIISWDIKISLYFTFSLEEKRDTTIKSMQVGNSSYTLKHVKNIHKQDDAYHQNKFRSDN